MGRASGILVVAFDSCPHLIPARFPAARDMLRGAIAANASVEKPRCTWKLAANVSLTVLPPRCVAR